MIFKRLALKVFSEEDAKKMMQTLDDDGNGTVEFEEFLKGLPKLAKWVEQETNDSAPSPSRPKCSTTSSYLPFAIVAGVLALVAFRFVRNTK